MLGLYGRMSREGWKEEGERREEGSTKGKDERNTRRMSREG